MSPGGPTSTAAVVRIAAGARHAEAAVIEHALSSAERMTRTGDLSRPVFVVVPSQSLRLHIMARLVAARGGSVLGVQCTTHFGLALRVVERMGAASPWDLDLFAILARRFARKEPSLSDALEHLHDGYSGILGAVRDLLDAGFLIEHLEVVEEALEDDGPRFASAEEVARARALARVTARVLVSFAELGVGRTSTLLQTATEMIRDQPDRALGADGVVLHGFADATGVTGDFLDALMRAYGGLAILDHPPDPVMPGTVDTSARFTHRLEERLRGVGELEVLEAPPSASRVQLFRALGQEAEVHEVAYRCLDLLDQGAAPEAIGIVLRDPTPYVTLFRGVFEQLALPFSGTGLRGPATPLGRRMRAMVELTMRGSRVRVDRWLDALPGGSRGVALFDVRIALASIGVSRLEELAELDIEPLLINDAYALPVRQGLFEDDENGDERREIRTRRRRVSGRVLRALAEDARHLTRQLDDWSGAALSLPDHLQRLEAMFELLGWSDDGEERREAADHLAALGRFPPVIIEQDEFAHTLRRALSNAARAEVAGQGGGIQVMGVVDARARTFEHLFVLGMNRGVFPRTVREDAVLSDPLRKLLERGGHGILPDLPIKRRGYEEERYLFAQLLSSSPEVTLSWLERDDADRAAPPSPLVERLRWCDPDRPEEWKVVPLTGRNPILDMDSSGRLDGGRLERLPPQQQGVLAALYGRTTRLAEVLPPILSRTSPAGEALDYGRVAAARLAVIEELDPTSMASGRDCLSPFFGFVGPVRGKPDPRANHLVYITALERMAVCPWQTFIERLLHVETVPDPLDALPSIDGLLIGSLVHRVLERIVARAVDRAPQDVRALDAALAVPVDWPSPEELERLVTEEAVRTVQSAGIALRGFDRALAAVVRPYLEMARAVDWADGRPSSLGAEIEGEVDLDLDALTRRSIGFRADRVDRRDGGLLLTDYKTGNSPYTQTTARTRRVKLLREVASGRGLQPVLYSMVAGSASSSGRLSFLRPDLKVRAEARSVLVSAADGEIRAAFEASVKTILGAWDQGLFFPRLENPGEPHKMPRDCRWCRVSEACLRQDSGARRRLREGMEELEGSRGARHRTSPISDSEALLRATLLDHWWLPSPAARPAGEP